MHKVIFELRWLTQYAVFISFFTLTINAHALTASQVFDKVKDSVVVVMSYDAKGAAIGQGSGVFLPNGKIGTNCHVVKNGESYKIGRGKQFVPASFWGGDEDKDICLLDATGLTGEPTKLGQASRLRIGEPVYAIGAPRGLELSLSDGIVSQLRGVNPPLIQTTAAISPGSSGGGLFDAEGQLVGFTSLYVEGGQNLNFAMPVEWVEEIQSGKKVAQGRSEIDWLKGTISLHGKELRDWCKMWTQAQPENSMAWVALGQSYSSYKKAIGAYKQAIHINSEDASAWYFLGNCYLNLKQYTEAIEAYRQTIRINPDIHTAWHYLGSAYSHLGQYSKAIEAYRQSIRIFPDNPSTWSDLGQIYTTLNRNTDAIEAYREAARINPKDANLLHIIGVSYLVEGNRTAALDVLRQLRQTNSAEADKLFKIIVPMTVASNNANSEWFAVSSDKNQTAYANPSTVRRNGEIVKMWDLFDFKKLRTKDMTKYKSFKVQTEYDCTENRSRSLSTTWHSDNMGSGNAVFTYDTPSEEWSPIAPGSVGEILWTVACFK
jgi:tetratricopeptide (TPR) repeat protein